MKYNRHKIIDQLIASKVETVKQWAIQDSDSLQVYITNVECLDTLDDDTLMNMAENEFNIEFD